MAKFSGAVRDNPNAPKITKIKVLPINALKKDMKELKEENKTLKEEIKVLKQDNIVLKNNNDKLTKKINKLEDDKQKFDALVKLHECNALVNKEFKKFVRQII
jgi:cell division protein FtsB